MPICARLLGTQSYRLSRNLVPLTRIELVITAYQADVIPFNYKGYMFGTPPEIRTQNSRMILPFEESDFTNLSRGATIWYQELDSNQPHLVLQTSALPDELSWHIRFKTLRGDLWELNPY